MEIKQALILETQKNDFTFTFILPQGATWGSAIDAAYEMLQKINQLAQENADKLKPVTPEESNG